MVKKVAMGLIIYGINMALDTFSEKFHDDRIQILSMAIDDNFIQRFNNIIWQENQCNTITIEDLRKRWNCYQLAPVRCFKIPTGSYYFDTHHLNLFLSDYGFNPISLTYNDKDGRDGTVNDGWILVDKFRGHLFIIIQNKKDSWNHKVHYWGLKFTAYGKNSCYFNRKKYYKHGKLTNNNDLDKVFKGLLMVFLPWLWFQSWWLVDYLWHLLQLFFND